MSNMFTALAYGSPFNTQSSDGSFPNNQFGPGFCTQGAWNVGNGMIPAEEGACPYVDPNPVESINGEGHNYFRSKNPYKLRFYALFGERSEEHTSELQSLMRISYAVFCSYKKQRIQSTHRIHTTKHLYL